MYAGKDPSEMSLTSKLFFSKMIYETPSLNPLLLIVCVLRRDITLCFHSQMVPVWTGFLENVRNRLASLTSLKSSGLPNSLISPEVSNSPIFEIEHEAVNVTQHFEVFQGCPRLFQKFSVCSCFSRFSGIDASSR